jgi:hypothetical protein
LDAGGAAALARLFKDKAKNAPSNCFYLDLGHFKFP